MGNVLAKSGVKMVFIFMQRLWRVGNEVDVDSCLQVMRSAIEEIQQIPVSGFFNLGDNECDTLPFWSGVTEQTYEFLKSTVTGIDPNSALAPLKIRNEALVLLLEMGLLYSSLSMQLRHVIMLIELSGSDKTYPYLQTLTETSPLKPMSSARILSVLKRLAAFVRKTTDEIGNADKSPKTATNPCMRLLNWMNLDTVKDGDESAMGEDVDICLLNAAVYIMCCLDSLTMEHQLSYAAWYEAHLMNNTNINNQNTGQTEKALINSFPQVEKFNHKLYFIRLNLSQNLLKNDLRDSKLDMIELKSDSMPTELTENFRIKKVVCSGVNTYILTCSGWLYEINSTSDDIIETFTFKHNSINYQFDNVKSESSAKLRSSNKIIDVDANIYSSHVLAINELGQVFSWGTNTSGKLGHDDMKDRKRPTIIEFFFRLGLLVKHVACGEEHSLILTQTGEIYGCGRNHMGQLGLGDVKDRHLPTCLTTADLIGVVVTQIAVDGHQSMCLTSNGLILTWGSTFDNCRRHSINWFPKIENCIHEYRNEIEQIQVHDSTYTILLRSGSVYTWLKYCVECNKSDDLQPELDTVLKYQVDNVAVICKGEGEFYFLDKTGIIRTKKLMKISEHKFSGFGFIKRNFFLAWSSVKETPKLTQPFILEVSIESLKLLSSLIWSIVVNFGTMESENSAEKSLESNNWFQYLLRINANTKYELTEDRLCILVSSLHLLSVQLQKVVDEQLTIPNPLLIQLKRDIINCCCGAVSQLHISIKHAAHMCLISGWKILFSSQMEKLLGIYYTLQISEPSMSRYNLIVAMCLDTIDLKKFINTLIELTMTSNGIGNSDLPSVEWVLETIIKYTFTNIRGQLKLPTVYSFKCTDNTSHSGRHKDLFDNNSSPINGPGSDSDHSIIDKLLKFLTDLLKQTVFLLKESKSIQDSIQPTLKLILSIYGRQLAQQTTETLEHCWTLIGKSNISPKPLISTLNRSGFSHLLVNLIESIRWLLKNYLQTKSILKPDHKSSRNTTRASNTNPMLNYEILFKFSINIREIVFGFRPLILLLDKINRLDESVSIIDSEDGSLPGFLYNPLSQSQQANTVQFRMKDIIESNGQLVVVEDRVYDVDKLSTETRERLENLLPDKKTSVILTEIVYKSLYNKEIIGLLFDCYCGIFIDDESQPITFYDNDSEHSNQLYFIERMLLMLLSDVLLFHQNCCNLMKRSIGFRQLQEFSIDKLPPVLKHIILKKKPDQSQSSYTETANPTMMSFSYLEEKERDELEETKDLVHNSINSSNDENNRKIINTCISLLMYGSVSSLMDKGTSIMSSILYWIRSDQYKAKNLTKTANSTMILDNIQDPNLDFLFVLILISLARHNGICDELAIYITRRNYEQPMSTELKTVIQNSISIRKDVIKRHQQTSVAYKELCASIIIRCRFLIDEIELLSVSNTAVNTRKKSINPSDSSTELFQSNRWKIIASKALSTVKKSKKSVDYWQIVFNFVSKKFINTKTKLTPLKSPTNKTENCDTINEFCVQIGQFLLSKEAIDLQKLRTLVLAKKVQYKCMINVLREFKSLLQFSTPLLPGLQTSLLQFFSPSQTDIDLNDSSNEDEQIYEVLQSINSSPTSNFVSFHTKQSLLQSEQSLIQFCIQLLRDNILLNEQKMESLRCQGLLNRRAQIVGVGHWPNAKLNLCLCSFLQQSITWSSEISSLAVSSGLLGVLQTVFRQYYETEPGLVSIWCQQTGNYQLLSTENKGSNWLTNRRESSDDANNSEIATPSQLKKGKLVLRGRDWKYGDQDGPNSVGIVKREVIDGMVRVQWLNNKKTGSYRAGKDDCYDLRLKKSIEDVNNENYSESGLRSLKKDVSLLQEKFLSNRLQWFKGDEIFSRLSANKTKIEADSTLSKHIYPCEWTRSSMLLLQCIGQLMQSIVIQQLVVNGLSKTVTPCQITLKKIYQLLWLIYKNGILSSIHRNDSIKNMYQEQINLWCSESFLLMLLNQPDLLWPDCDSWIDLFLTKAELEIKLSCNESFYNQILTFKIIEKLLDKSAVDNVIIDRLWNCLELSISSHCSQNPHLVFNMHSFNASPSKIRIMELTLIFRKMLQISSKNHQVTRHFLFNKISQTLLQPDNHVQFLGIFCLFSDVENRIYPGIPVSIINKNSELNESVSLGVVEDIGIVDNEKYAITTASVQSLSSSNSSIRIDKDFNCHMLTSDMKIDASKIQFPYEIFNSLSQSETEIISKFLLMLLSNFANSNEDTLANISSIHGLFNIMQLSTVMEFCEDHLASLWYPLYQINHEIFKQALNIATRSCSIKPIISIYELKRALNQLSVNLNSSSSMDEAIVVSDKSSDVEVEETSYKKSEKRRHWKSSSFPRESNKSKHRESEFKNETLNITSALQYRIMEMGFTKRQIQSAVRELSHDGHLYLTLNPELIVTTILSLQQDDDYSLSPVDNAEDDDDDEDDDSTGLNMSEEESTCSTLSEGLPFLMPRHLNQSGSALSLNSSDEENIDDQIGYEEIYSNEDDADNCSSSAENDQECENKPKGVDTEKLSNDEFSVFENVICKKAFDAILVGDKGCLHMAYSEDQVRCNVFWTKLNTFIDTDRANIHIFTCKSSSIMIRDEVKFSDVGIKHHSISAIPALSIGVVRQIIGNELDLKFVVDFPHQLGMICDLSHLKLVAKNHRNYQCQCCLKHPLPLPVHKCKVCRDLYLCSDCYARFEKNHVHKFSTIPFHGGSPNMSSINADNLLHTSRKLQSFTISTSFNKTEFKQCLSFTNWLLHNHSKSSKNVEFAIDDNCCLVKVADGYQINAIYMLISLSEFLVLPSHVLIKAGSKLMNLAIVSRAHVQSLKEDEIIINSPTYYNPGSKLMWLKVFDEKSSQVRSNSRVFSVTLFDESGSIKAVFNAVKSFHYQLSKTTDSDTRLKVSKNHLSDLSTANNENLLKSIFSISDKNWSTQDIDNISNDIVVSWRQARVNKFRFQVDSNSKNPQFHTYVGSESISNVNSPTSEMESNCQGDILRKNRLKSKVYTWGLNDKDQLGCEATSKVKLPILNEALSELDCVSISGGSKSLFCVTRRGKVYAAGDPSNGRLGIGSVTEVVSGPKKLETLDKYFIVKVAVHSGGRHAIALTKNGEAFSWGEGDDGKLGHNSRMKLDSPKKIQFFKDKRVVDVACGSSHSAVIVFGGHLYTWGLGDYGRLGHGDTSTKLLPELVKNLRDHKVVQVACGSRDAQTLALTSDFNVWSWGDGDFGKLGRGGSSGCLVPQKIECMSLHSVIQIECGAQSSFALTESGQVWTWGKGDYYRLGHGQDKHIREPMVIEDLKNTKIVHLAVGALHCLAATDQGHVYSWGDNDHGQQGNGTVSYNTRPTLVTALADIKIAHVSCGSSHSVAWTASDLDSFVPAPSINNRWPHIKELFYSLAVIDFCPMPFQFNPDPLGSSDLLDIDVNIHQKKSKLVEPEPNPSVVSEQADSCTNVAIAISQLRGRNLQANVIQSLFVNLQVLVARKLVFQMMSLKTPQSSTTIASPVETNTVSSILNEQLTTLHNFLLVYDYLKLQNFASGQSILNIQDFLKKINFTASTNLRQTALLLLIDDIEKYGDKDFNKHNNLHYYCDNKEFINLIKKPSSISYVRESPHPYAENSKLCGKVIIPGAPRLILEFDRQCSTERNKDVLTLMDQNMSIVSERSGQRWEDWESKLIINGNELHWVFKSDGSVTAWGWRFEVRPLWKLNQDSKKKDEINDLVDYTELSILFLPNLQLIKGLLSRVDLQFEDTSLALQLIKALSHMAFNRGALDCESRIWAVRQITDIVCSNKLGVRAQFMKAVDSFSDIYSRFDSLNVLQETATSDSGPNNVDIEAEVSSEDEQPDRSTQLINDMDTICSFLLCLQKVVLKQFKFEEPEVKSSKQLFYSRFLKSLLELSCHIRLDSLSPVCTADEWAWFRNYCLTFRTTESLVSNSSLPYRFIKEFKARFLKEPTVKDPVSKEICELTAVSEYADPREFGFQHDVELVSWLKCRPEAWKKCWPTDSASGLEVWSWGHNHRGQLGGVEGSKIKVPVQCEHLSALRPKQIIGGEQSLFIVSTDGRVYATGFGNNGRLGIGSSESVQTPILVSGLEEKVVVKVAVNSGGKHCLALCNNGLVYAWGDAEDNKLGLDFRLQPGEDVLTPTLIKSLVKAEIVDIAAGGSHSAAISRSGELYTWGKGRYGRLGHGNGDDQPYPKIVEALRGYHVIGVACGSGDAQTLCITKPSEEPRDESVLPNTSVWSWGDGDYGKLGRGGFEICKLPMKIETLEGAGVIKVDCGSQFSLALTANGEVFTWGKGDYFRLGHGSDSHIRKPEKVGQLSRKKITDVACGSLHCICCTEDGEVFSWGDNDEGQLGDGTTTTNSRPRVIETLSGKGVNRVACGSAHTLAWTTVSGNKAHEAETPEQRLVLATRPAGCRLLENKSAQSLINRFLLLHHWTELFCANLHFFQLNRAVTMDAVRQILLPSSKESLFRLMIQTTMYGSKKHGPEIKVNRLHASAGTPAGVSILYRNRWIESDCGDAIDAAHTRESGTGHTGTRAKIQLEKTVFGQLGSKLIEEADCIGKNGSVVVPPPDFFLLPNRVWKVKLIGESVDDCGGGYSESITEICDELQNGHLPFLISSPDRDCFVFSPNTDKADSKWIIFLGCLLGIAIRTNQPLSLTISDLIWKILSGQSLCKNDLQLLDKDLVTGLMSLKSMESGELEDLQLPFTVTTIDGREINLPDSCPDVAPSSMVTAANLDQYIDAVIDYKVHEFDEISILIRRGMSLVIPLPLLNLFSSRELECLVCGNDSIPIAFLKSITLYRGVKSDDLIILWFWEIMEEMTNEVRSLFLRFVWGRTRLPRYVSDLRGKEFVIQVLSKYSPADEYLPEAYTCFFLLKLPSYSSKAIFQEKLLYAIHFCKSIDIDDYARIALNPDSLPCQEVVTPRMTRRDRVCTETSSSGSATPRIYISNSSSSSSSSSSQYEDSDASTARAPNALFDSSPSVSGRYSIQRNNQYLVSDYMDLFSGVFDAPRFIDLSLDTEANDDDDSSDDEHAYISYSS